MFYGLYMKFIQLHYSKRISRCYFTLFYGRRNEGHVYIVRTCQLYHRIGISQERARKVPPVQIAAVQVGPLAHFPSRGDPGPMLLQHRAKLGSGDHVLARRLRCVPGSIGARGPARLPIMSAWSLHHHSHCRARLFLAPVIITLAPFEARRYLPVRRCCALMKGRPAALARSGAGAPCRRSAGQYRTSLHYGNTGGANHRSVRDRRVGALAGGRKALPRKDKHAIRQGLCGVESCTQSGRFANAVMVVTRRQCGLHCGFPI